MIGAMIEIAREIQPCGVRAIAYQLFNRKFIPSMAKRHTQQVSRWATVARESGDLPWQWIVDETREEEVTATWDDPPAYARAVMGSYRRNKWKAQPVHVELWCEKGTIAGALRPVIEEFEVPLLVLHGWSGASTVMQTVEANYGRDQDTLLLYLGDYDPSGMWMSERDLPQRLARYHSENPAERNLSPAKVKSVLAGVRLSVRRIALTKGDTRALGVSTRFPAAEKATRNGKKGDSRYEWFVRTYGDWC
jgi:hypothetical protein